MDLMAMLYDVKEKLTDGEYKKIVDEIAQEKKRNPPLGKIRVIVPIIRKEIINNEIIISIEQKFMTFIVLMDHIIAKRWGMDNIVNMYDLNNISITHDARIEDMMEDKVGDLKIISGTGVIISIGQLKFAD